MQKDKINSLLVIFTIVLAVVCYIQHNQIEILRDRLIKLEIRHERLIVKLEDHLSGMADNITDMQNDIDNMKDDLDSLMPRRK